MRRAFQFGLTAMVLASAVILRAPAYAQAADAPPASASPANANSAAENSADAAKPVVLDRVVAIINGDVVLESDVQEEMHFAKLEPVGVPSGSDSLRRSARRLINRTLILQQIKEQQQAGVSVSDAEVEKQLDEIRKSLPACKEYDCTTEAGWKAFLSANGLTQQDVFDHWRQRMQILRFIDIRFRAGIRISKQEIADYYQKSILPGYAHAKDKPPSVDTLAPRIQEVLLQQHVNGLLRDWIKTLRQEGSVQILDPAYGQSSSGDEDDE
jgi:peptidyl-prolyl cis-trans isomerase SurA